MAKDTAGTDSGKKTEKAADRKSGEKSDKKDGKKDSMTLNPERQKVVTERYRDGWSSIWKSKN